MTPGAVGQSGLPGAVVTYTLSVTNTGNASDTYTVTISGNAFVTNAPASIGPLAAGANTTLNVVVTIPAGAAGGAVDAANVKITDNFTFYVNALNVLDIKPKFDPSAAYSIFQYNPAWGQANMIGRYFRVGAKVDL